MSYATVSDLVLRYSEREIRQRTDRENVGAIVDAVAQQALDKADALIDARLRVRYAVPVSPVPLAIKDIAEILARWKLFDDNPPESIVKDAERALAELDKYARGILTLDVASVGVVVDGEVELDAQPRLFTRGTLR